LQRCVLDGGGLFLGLADKPRGLVTKFDDVPRDTEIGACLFSCGSADSLTAVHHSWACPLMLSKAVFGGIAKSASVLALLAGS
jgi:hypothetical protein